MNELEKELFEKAKEISNSQEKYTYTHKERDWEFISKDNWIKRLIYYSKLSMPSLFSTHTKICVIDKGITYDEDMNPFTIIFYNSKDNSIIYFWDGHYSAEQRKVRGFLSNKYRESINNIRHQFWIGSENTFFYLMTSDISNAIYPSSKNTDCEMCYLYYIDEFNEEKKDEFENLVRPCVLYSYFELSDQEIQERNLKYIVSIKTEEIVLEYAKKRKINFLDFQNNSKEYELFENSFYDYVSQSFQKYHQNGVLAF